jgi:hypothetical protein
LNTLSELAQALANDPNHATTVFNQLATKATTAYVDGQLVLKANQSNTYTMTQVDSALAGKHPLLTATSDITINRLYAKSIEPPTGTTSIQFRSNSVSFGITAYASIRSTLASFFVPVYMTQGLEINTSLKVGNGDPITAMFTVAAATGNIVTFGTIECYNGITTYENITCNALAATNIYTKTEVDNLLTPKATVTYVNEQLTLKSKSGYNIYQNRNR